MTLADDDTNSILTDDANLQGNFKVIVTNSAGCCMKLISVKLEFVLILAAGIIQVSDSIAWVRCASGNV